LRAIGASSIRRGRPHDPKKARDREQGAGFIDPLLSIDGRMLFAPIAANTQLFFPNANEKAVTDPDTPCTARKRQTKLLLRPLV
jgi:hypothetical protein